MEMKKSKTFVIKSKTNEGDLCKQIFFIAGAEEMDDALIIHKRVLTDRIEAYEKSGYTKIKVFRNKALFEQRFGIKNTSLNKAINFFNSLSVASS